MLTLSNSCGPKRRTWKQSASTLLALGLWLASLAPAAAQLPVARITSIFPPGGKQGESVEVAVTGSDLEETSRLQFSHPGITATPKLREPAEFETAPQPIANQFTVRIAADVPPGLYEVRSVGKYGISNPRMFAVGNLAETVEKEPNETLETAQEIPLDGVLNGRSNRSGDLDHFRFTAKAGQRVLIECRARPLDSRLDAALAVFDASGHELARKYDGSLHDTMLDFTAPADGAYAIKVHDFVYAGGDEYAYRLSVSTKPRVDFVFPPAGIAGTKATYQVYGRNLPGGKLAEGVKIDGKPLEVVSAEIELPAGAAAESLPAARLIEPAESGIDAFAYRLSTPQGAAEPALIGFASAPIVVEQEPNNEAAGAQKVSVPCECEGQFYPQGDQDWFAFEAKRGDKYVIEVISQRQGAIADPFLLVEQVTTDKEGKQQAKELKSEDDVGDLVGGPDYNARHDDPVYRFTAPADGVYRVLVRDLYFGSRGDPRFVYRLAIRPEQPDFRLAAMPKFSGSQPNANQQQPVLWSSLLRKGGTELIDLVVFRRDGFDGEIVVTAEDLPKGVSAQPAVIAAGHTTASLVLTAAADAPGAEFAAFRLVGRAKVGDKEVAHEARAASIVWPGQLRQASTHSRLSTSLALAVSEVEQAPFYIEPKQGALFEMCRGGQLEIPLTITRGADFQGPVQVTASDLPRGFQRNNNMTIAGNAKEAKLALAIPANAPLGTFSFYLRATAKHNYRRNPEAAEAAAKRKEEMNKLVAELIKTVKQSNEAKQAADKLLAAAEQKARSAKQAHEDAAEAHKEAELAVKTAMQEVEAAKKALEDDPDNKELVKEAGEAEKRLGEAEELQTKTAESEAETKKAADEAARAAEAAEEKQSAAEKAVADAEARSKRAEKAKTAAEKAASQAADAARPKNVNLGAPSQIITLAITQSPIKLSVSAPSEPIVPGQKREAPVEISRLYGYAEQVQLSVALPKGVNGLKVVAAPVPAKQDKTKLVIEAASNATPGKHSLTITATSRLNNQQQQLTQEVVIEIAAPEKPAKTEGAVKK